MYERNDTLRNKIINYLAKIIMTMVIIVMLCMMVMQVGTLKRNVDSGAREMFLQIEHILSQNAVELRVIEQRHRENCLSNVRTIAYIVQHNPEILARRDVAEIRRVAGLVQVDEIHIFNREGVIVFGTAPEYFGLNVDSGEQIRFFKAMLTDTSLQLVQEMKPNTGAGRPVQYSAMWSEDGQFIVQAGVYPDTVMDAKRKNELSYIFSMLRINGNTDLFAISKESGEILGCTDTAFLQKNSEEIGLKAEKLEVLDEGFFARIDGVENYAIFTEINGMLVGYAVPVDAMFRGTLKSFLLFTVGLLLLAIIAFMAVSRFMEKYVIDDIQIINRNLQDIASGNLDTRVEAKSSEEFSKLSGYINDMVGSLLAIQRQVEEERDMDLLTGLFNRWGLKYAFEKLESGDESVGKCAMIMVDADGLKKINDELGHDNGDAYLVHVAEVLKQAGQRKSIAARQGGDEYVLFLYGYEDEMLLERDIELLQARQDGQMVELLDGIEVEMKFSMGYCKSDASRLNYEYLCKEADDMMYADKRDRKCRAGVPPLSCPLPPPRE